MDFFEVKLDTTSWDPLCVFVLRVQSTDHVFTCHYHTFIC